MRSRAHLLLALALAAQLASHALLAPRDVAPHDLPAPPAPSVAILLSLGEPAAASRLTALSLQFADETDGASRPWRSLDYHRLRGWLALCLALDPQSQYPLLLATDVYGAVRDEARLREMLDFVREAYRADPPHRAPWLQQAVVAARYRLHDPVLAQSYARDLHATPR